ncbi:MAG TPA: hypothetical protein VMT88_01140 [Actinomycetes bacterium]|nr:hypothetical protein [Actinomycetes bacterium]
MISAALDTVVTLHRLVENTEDATNDDFGPGLVAFLIVVALAIATFFLIRSMLTHINKVPPTFDPPAETNDEPPSADGSPES